MVTLLPAQLPRQYLSRRTRAHQRCRASFCQQSLLPAKSRHTIHHIHFIGQGQSLVRPSLSVRWTPHAAVQSQPTPVTDAAQNDVPNESPGAASPGLMGMPGWHRPSDLVPWVRGVLQQLGELRADLGACDPGAGLRLLALLHDHELLLRNSHRPARYCLDYHPSPTWRAASAAVLGLLDEAAARLYGDASVYDKLRATEGALARIAAWEAEEATEGRGGADPRVVSAAAAANGHEVKDGKQAANADGVLADVLAERIRAELRHNTTLQASGVSQWLQLCRAMLPSFRSRTAVAAASAAVASANAACGTDGHQPADRQSPTVVPDAATGAPAEGARGGTTGGDRGGGGSDGEQHPSLERLQAAMAQCTEALRRLATGCPPLAPRLALHPAQYDVLRPWLPDSRLPGGAGGGVTWLSGPELLELYDSTRHWADVDFNVDVDGADQADDGGQVRGSVRTGGDAGGAGPREGLGGASAAGNGRGGGSGGNGGDERLRRRLVKLYDGAEVLDLDEILLDGTDEALELAVELTSAQLAAEAEAAEREQPLLAVVELTPEVSGRLLQLHPNEGVRWQVYHSGPLRQARAMLLVLDRLTVLRSQLATVLGYDSWGDMVLQGGTASSAGGTGGGGGAGSALGGRDAVIQMLRELGAGLLPYGDSELAALQRDARRLGGRSGSAFPADADPLEPWNLPYVLQGLAQGKATSRYDNAWESSYADYFAPPALLQGSDALCRALFDVSLMGPVPMVAGEVAGWVPCADSLGSGPSGHKPSPPPPSSSLAEGGRKYGPRGVGSDDGSEVVAEQDQSREDQSREDLLAALQRDIEQLEAGTGFGPGGGGQDEYGSDVLVKMAVVCCRTSRLLGLLYFHLHGNLSEYPMTTLLYHGPVGLRRPALGGAAPSRSYDTGVSYTAGGNDHGRGDGGIGDLEERLPTVLVRLPYRPSSESECGGPESPYFLKAWIHELGHALHFVLSAAACDVTVATPLLAPSPPPPNPNAPHHHTGETSSASSSWSPHSQEQPADSSSPDHHTRSDIGTPGQKRSLLALLSGAACPLDVRELPSHLMEHVLRDPHCVRVLSRHGRLDCPLPQRDCARLVAQLATRFTSTVGELQGLIAASLADQLMHAPLDLGFARPPSPPSSPSPHPQSHPQQGGNAAASAPSGQPGGVATQAFLEAQAAVCSLAAHHGIVRPSGSVVSQEEDQQQQKQEQETVPLLLVPGPDNLHHMEALAVVGGAKYVYVASRLFAAAAWRAYFQDELQDGLPCPSGRADDDDDGGDNAADREASGGWLVRRQLLEAGAHWPGIAILSTLLGDDAFEPCKVSIGSRSTDGSALDVGGVGPGGACDRSGAVGRAKPGERFVAGVAGAEQWVPNLGAAVFQDVDLLG